MPSHPQLQSSPESLYTDEERERLDPRLLPEHIAIIMDGNRRWAQNRSLPPHAGHFRGADTLTHIVRAASQLNIQKLTVFGLSTENWKRTRAEIDTLMQLIKYYLIDQRENMQQEGVRLDTIGDLSALPIDVQEEIETTKQLTAQGSKIDLILALNYGGRDDITRATKTLAKACMEGALSLEDLNEATISKHLDTGRWNDPELIIRTSGEHRLSNFLLWQASYSEVIITDVLWPDFSAQDLLLAMIEYQKREKREGI